MSESSLDRNCTELVQEGGAQPFWATAWEGCICWGEPDTWVGSWVSCVCLSPGSMGVCCGVPACSWERRQLHFGMHVWQLRQLAFWLPSSSFLCGSSDAVGDSLVFGLWGGRWLLQSHPTTRHGRCLVVLLLFPAGEGAVLKRVVLSWLCAGITEHARYHLNKKTA